MTGELVKPDLLTVPAQLPLTLQAMEEPPQPLDMQQLWEELEMPSNEFLQKDPLLQRKLLYEYQDIFSSTTTGCTELQLCLKPGTQPIQQKFHNLNPRQEAELEAQLETWLAEGIIKPSISA